MIFFNAGLTYGGRGKPRVRNFPAHHMLFEGNRLNKQKNNSEYQRGGVTTYQWGNLTRYVIYT